MYAARAADPDRWLAGMRPAEPVPAGGAHGQPQLMRAWQVAALGEPAEVMTPDDVPAPGAAPGTSLVEVLATALNFPDVLWRAALYQVRPPLPFTPGRRGLRPGGRGRRRRRAAAGSATGSSACRRCRTAALAELGAAARPRRCSPPGGAGRRRGGRPDSPTRPAYFGLHRRAALRAGETAAGARGRGRRRQRPRSSSARPLGATRHRRRGRRARRSRPPGAGADP